MFESPSTSDDDDDMDNGVSKTTLLEPTIKPFNEINKPFP